MIIKTGVLLSGLCAALLYLLWLQNPDDDLFLFVSSNRAIVISRVILAAIFIIISFRQHFTYKETRFIFGITATLLTVFGFIGISIQSVDYGLIGVINPLDYLYFIGTGLMMLLTPLTYKHRWTLFSRGVGTQTRLEPQVSRH